MAWVVIPDSDLDANSALKTQKVLGQLRDNWKAIADCSAPLANRLGLGACRLENKPAGFIRSDGNPLGSYRCVVAPVEAYDVYVFDDDTVWTPPLGVRQMIVEAWGGGASAQNSGGFAGSYCMKLLTVSPGTDLVITIGLGGIPGGGAVVPGNDTTVTYGVFTMQASGGNSGAPTGGDVNIQGGSHGPAPRGGGFDPIAGNTVGCSINRENNVKMPGGNGRVIVRVFG